MKIQKVLPIQDRQYQDQQGQQRVFTSMGFVLTDGVDTLFAEATGDYARSLVGYLNEGDTVRTQLSMGVRDWQDQQWASVTGKTSRDRTATKTECIFQQSKNNENEQEEQQEGGAQD